MLKYIKNSILKYVYKLMLVLAAKRCYGPSIFAKNFPTLPLSEKCSHWINLPLRCPKNVRTGSTPPLPLSVWTNHKFRKIRSFFCTKKCGRLHLKTSSSLVRKMSALDNPLTADVLYGRLLTCKKHGILSYNLVVKLVIL